MRFQIKFLFFFFESSFQLENTGVDILKTNYFMMSIKLFLFQVIPIKEYLFRDNSTPLEKSDINKVNKIAYFKIFLIPLI